MSNFVERNCHVRLRDAYNMIAAVRAIADNPSLELAQEFIRNSLVAHRVAFGFDPAGKLSFQLSAQREQYRISVIPILVRAAMAEGGKIVISDLLDQLGDEGVREFLVGAAMQRMELPPAPVSKPRKNPEWGG